MIEMSNNENVKMPERLIVANQIIKNPVQKFQMVACPKCGKNLFELSVTKDDGYNYLSNSDLVCTSCGFAIAPKV